MSKDARSIIVDLIQESDDKTLGPGKHFRSKCHLGEIFFSDFMDIVMYYIFLQSDIDDIAQIKMDDFRDLLKNLWDGLEEKKANKFYDLFGHPWLGGNSDWSGPYFVGAGLDYFRSTPGIELHNEFLLEYFKYPKELKGQSRHHRWPDYKEAIEKGIFPKYRRKKHTKILHEALDFAEKACQELREKSK